MAVKTFGAARAEAVGTSLPFNIGAHRFEVPLPAPAVPLLDLAAVADEDDEAKIAAAFYSFIFGVLDADDHERFRSACAEVRLSLEELLELVQWLIEEAVGRPTQRLSRSAAQPSNTGTSSNGASRKPGKRR